MSKQDWLDYFEAVNGRSASAEEIAQALAAGEFQEEVVVPETPQAPEFVAAPTTPVEEPVAAPQAPEFVAAPAAPQAPDFVAAPTAPTEEPVAAPQAPEFVAAPAAPQAPEKNHQQLSSEPAAPTVPQKTCSSSSNKLHSKPTNNLLKQLINKLLTKVNQDNLILAQPSQFGVAVGGYWNWFLSALKRPTAVENPKALNGILQYVLTAFVLTLSTFFTASGFTGGYGMDFRAFMLTLISLFFSVYAFQVAGFFVRRVVLQDKEYSYGRSFEEFGRLSVYTLPLALLAFLVGLVKVYEFYGFVNFLIFFLFFVGTCYVVHQGLNKTSF